MSIAILYQYSTLLQPAGKKKARYSSLEKKKYVKVDAKKVSCPLMEGITLSITFRGSNTLCLSVCVCVCRRTLPPSLIENVDDIYNKEKEIQNKE